MVNLKIHCLFLILSSGFKVVILLKLHVRSSKGVKNAKYYIYNSWSLWKFYNDNN